MSSYTASILKLAKEKDKIFLDILFCGYMINDKKK